MGYGFCCFFLCVLKLISYIYSITTTKMKADNSNKLVTIEVTIQGIWAASKHMVHQSKKSYKRSREKQKRNYAE